MLQPQLTTATRSRFVEFPDKLSDAYSKYRRLNSNIDSQSNLVTRNFRTLVCNYDLDFHAFLLYCALQSINECCVSLNPAISLLGRKTFFAQDFRSRVSLKIGCMRPFLLAAVSQHLYWYFFYERMNRQR